MSRFDAALLPPSIADARGKAFAATVRQAMAAPDFKVLLFERIDTVDAGLLPFLVREFGCQKFVQPGMRDEVIRAILKEAYDLHAETGFIQGVRRGLSILGMDAVWQQWFETTPKGQPGTHLVTLYAGQTLFEDQDVFVDERVQRAAIRMVDATKRWSQDVTIRIGTKSASSLGMSCTVTIAPAIQIEGSFI